MSDYISRQALMKEFSDFVRRSNNSDFDNTPTWNDAVSLVGSMPSVPVDKGFIPRESAINTALNMYHRCNGSLEDYRVLMVESLEVLTGMPPAPVREVKRGRWNITDAYPHNVYCSVCHTKFAQTHWAVWEDGSLPRNFCPYCGADMRRDGDET